MMMRTGICIVLIFLLVGCSFAERPSGLRSPESEHDRENGDVGDSDDASVNPRLRCKVPFRKRKPLQASCARRLGEKVSCQSAEQPVPPATEAPLKVIPLSPEKGDVDKAGAEGSAAGGFLS